MSAEYRMTFEVGDKVGLAEFPDRYFVVKEINSVSGEALLVGHHTSDTSRAQVQKWKSLTECRKINLGAFEHPQNAPTKSDGRPGIQHRPLPRRLRDEERFGELQRAIQEFTNALMKINPDWITEYNEIVQRFEQHGDKLY